MTADEITRCIDDFRNQYGVAPHTVFADVETVRNVLIAITETRGYVPSVDGSVLFMGIQIVPDPQMHGIRIAA